MADATARKRKYSYPAATKRYQSRRNAEGNCRRCGTRPRAESKNGGLSPYCELCRARASQAELKRQARLRSEGSAKPSPNSPAWKTHLLAPDGGVLAACGASADINSTDDPAAVNCGNCARTGAFKTAQAAAKEER